ncbi:hypothetical protein [Vibrio hippocampi]|uniref:Uracil DNA glycosylase superfamily protein n=1 Tax=Vibrio hippocampi TaxID=654686 RepID=A0ABN8DF15_9VIBR|nr:hypothetical protein [Vibrio hippocampi]CAH0525416.1 hypothetical protein VHP8226_00964 [Vibrio hippocampi]
MKKTTLHNLSSEVRHCNPESPFESALELYRDSKVNVHYAPFEHINRKAKIVLCGITPGKTQAIEALSIAKTHLISGSSIELAQEKAKAAASFKGLRDRLVEMLDLVGLNMRLGIDSSADLFGAKSDIVHYTSALRYPVTRDNGDNYNGAPKLESIDYLVSMLDTYLAEEIRAVGPDCLWLPLGKQADEALRYMVKTGHLKDAQLLSGLPHPSGSNQERIKYFLGKKAKAELSRKVNPDKMDANKAALIAKVRAA